MHQEWTDKQETQLSDLELPNRESRVPNIEQGTEQAVREHQERIDSQKKQEFAHYSRIISINWRF